MPVTRSIHMTFAACAAAALLLAASLPAFADDAPKPGTPLYGRPETPEAKKLAPVAPPPLPTQASKLPKLTVPAGFKIEVYTSGIPNARSLTMGDKGTLFVGNWQANKVWAVVDKNGKRENKVLYQGLDWPNGVAFHDGTLYIAEHTKISKAEGIEDHLDNPPKLKTIYDKLGTQRPHGWRFLAVGPDNRLYVSNSSPCNICMPPATHGQIRSIKLDGSDEKVVARGIRNTVGFDFNPKNGQLYFTDNNRDWFSEDLPNGELNRITQPGKQHFGFPYCHQGNIPDPEFGWGHDCKDYTPPIALLGPARGAARHALLYRHHVPGEVSQHDLHRPARALEPDQEGRRRGGGRASRRPGQCQVDRGIHDRVHQGQHLCRPPGRRAGDEGRLAFGLRRLERSGLSHHLRLVMRSTDRHARASCRASSACPLP